MWLQMPYVTCVTHTGAKARRFAPDASYSKHAASVSASTVSLLASEIRGLGRVLNTVNVCPLLDISCEILQPSKTELCVWWIKVLNSELTLASLLCFGFS